MKPSLSWTQLFCASLFMTMAGAAGAQSGTSTAASYPNKPVRLIQPYAAGGGTAPVAILVANRLNKDWGQPFLIDYRPGGDTIVGTTLAALAPADGYTLLLHARALVINHSLYQNLQYDALRDFTPISGLMRSESALVIHPSVPANDLKEFISYARANPGKLNAATSSPLITLWYQQLLNAAGTKFTLVNYKGTGESMNDLMGGTVQISMATVSNIASQVKAGKLRALGVSGPNGKRSHLLPDVPTFTEAGVKDFDPNNWMALLAPSKTPRDIDEKLNAKVRQILAEPEVVSALDKLGFDPFPMTLPQAQQFIAADIERYSKLVKDSGLKPGDF